MRSIEAKNEKSPSQSQLSLCCEATHCTSRLTRRLGSRSLSENANNNPYRNDLIKLVSIGRVRSASCKDSFFSLFPTKPKAQASLFPPLYENYSRNNMISVDKSHTTTSFKELADLVQPDNIKVLRLDNVAISGDEDDEFHFGRAVRGHPSLEELSLTNITLDKGMTLDSVIEMMLVSCHELHTLKLNGVPVRAKSCATLAYCETLTTLVLSNNGFNDIDAKIIADSVEANQSVVSVDLSGNKISDVGCKSLRLCLEKNTTIAEIKLSGNSISGSETSMLETKLQGRVAMAA